MTCPVCGGKTYVTNTATDEDCVYRQRTCVDCKHRFYTEETETDDNRTLLNLRQFGAEMKMKYRKARKKV